MGCSTGAVTMIEPVSYLDMLLLEGRSRVHSDRFGRGAEGSLLLSDPVYYTA